jgi:hypothetical protein
MERIVYVCSIQMHLFFNFSMWWVELANLEPVDTEGLLHLYGLVDPVPTHPPIYMTSFPVMLYYIGLATGSP